MTHRLSGKIAIVTGAGSGIGRASAVRFAAEGATVICVDLKGEDETAAAIGEAAVAVRADAGSEENVEGLVRGAGDRFGRLDVFFANAGISGGLASIFEQSPDDWHEILRVNLIGPSLAIKHAAPVMKAKGGGAIVCTASVAGLRAGAGGPAYSASKAGVIRLVQVAATQLAGSNVRVNAICPGLIETGMTKGLYDMARAAGKEDRIGHLNPMKRGGVPEEIAAAALFLASDDASYVNGHALVVDGGLSASHPFYRQEYGRTSF
ncbi:MAG TPA: SDR family oxidoreductase [Allosphingosinicella sp.]|jgi:NAD(P)-dependent dehydrogenase (short-subunit alcohol dehydrogenase family)